MNLSADEKLLIERMSARTPVLVLGAGFPLAPKRDREAPDDRKGTVSGPV